MEKNETGGNTELILPIKKEKKMCEKGEGSDCKKRDRVK